MYLQVNIFMLFILSLSHTESSQSVLFKICVESHWDVLCTRIVHKDLLSSSNGLSSTYLRCTLSHSPLLFSQSALDGQKVVVAGRLAEGAPGVETGRERHTVATHHHGNTDLKGTLGAMV